MIAFAANDVAFITGCDLSKEEPFSARPVSSGQFFGDAPSLLCRVRTCVRLRPRHQKATQRERAGTWIVCRVPVGGQPRGPSNGFHGNLKRDPIRLAAMLEDSLLPAIGRFFGRTNPGAEANLERNRRGKFHRDFFDGPLVIHTTSWMNGRLKPLPPLNLPARSR